MSYWEYLLKNRLWLMLGFILICAGFALVWVKQGNAGLDIKIMAITVGAMVLVFLIGNFIKWKQLH